MLGGRESSCQCISRSSWGLRSHWRIQNFNLWGPHGERGARAYNGGKQSPTERATVIDEEGEDYQLNMHGAF